MEVSTKLFNAQATKNFGKINEQIQDTQAKIASGKSFLKASDDPVTASNLSAKREQKILLERNQYGSIVSTMPSVLHTSDPRSGCSASKFVLKVERRR